MHGLPTARLLVIALWLVGTLAGSAGAQTDAGYKAVLAEALAEYRAENWPEARALFGRAHALKPNARTLRGMGLTAYQERRYVLAADLLGKALVHPRKPLTPKQRTQAQRFIERARSFISTLGLRLEPGGAQLEVDGQPVSLAEDGTLLVDPGTHELVIRAPGHRQQVRRLRAEPGEEAELRITLVVSQPGHAPAGRSGGPASGGAETADAPTDGPTGRTYTWIALGGAAGLAAAAGVFWGLGASEVSDVETRCAAQGGCLQDEADRLLSDSSASTYEALATVGLVLAGAAAVSGGVLYFVEGGPAGGQASVAVGVDVAAGEFVIEGAF